MLCAVALLVCVVILLVLYFSESSHEQHHYNEVHIHADFALYLDGERIDLTDDAYQSNDSIARHAFLHLHENEGDVFHIHAKQQTFAKFLRSLGMPLDDNCLFANDDIHCRADGLRLFVNDKEYDKPFDSYMPEDLDRILLTNTPDKDTLKQEMDAVTDKACIQSGSCPERGDPAELCSTLGDCPAPPVIEPLEYRYHTE